MEGDTADEEQQWNLVCERLGNLGFTKEEKRRVLFVLHGKGLPWAETFINIKPKDVTAVLRQQLQRAAGSSQFEARSSPPPPAAAVTTATVAAAAEPLSEAGPSPGAADPPYRALDILRTTYPQWPEEPCSDITIGRNYPELKMTTWEIDDGMPEQTEIKNYLRQKLENTVLKRDPIDRRIQELTPLGSETECNYKFTSFYGEPVAEIVRACCGRRILFRLDAPTVSATGEPDFSFFVDGHTELLRGECKSQTVMGSAATLFPPHEDAMLNSCARQICDYMRKTDRRYGWLTYFNGTFFIKRSEEDPHLYKFTRALPSCSSDITVLEMLTYIVLKQLEEGPWKALPHHQQQGPDVPNTHYEFNYTGPMTCSRAAANKQPVQNVASSSGALHSHPDWALRISSKRLGAGQCGTVIEGRYYGEASALKAIDLSKRYYQVSLLTNEISTYGHLTSLQGQCIPVLKGHGLWDNDNIMFLAMSVAEGQHLSRNTYGAMEAAVKALRRIHDMGVLHGDIRRQNILISKKGKDWQVWFLDFGHSSMSSDTAAQESELQELLELFRE